MMGPMPTTTSVPSAEQAREQATFRVTDGPESWVSTIEEMRVANIDDEHLLRWLDLCSVGDAWDAGFHGLLVERVS